MDIIAEGIPAGAAIPRFEDGRVNLQRTISLIAGQVANDIMDAEADQPCADGQLPQRQPGAQAQDLRG